MEIFEPEATGRNSVARKRKELPQIGWCQNDRNFGGFAAVHSDFYVFYVFLRFFNVFLRFFTFFNAFLRFFTFFTFFYVFVRRNLASSGLVWLSVGGREAFFAGKIVMSRGTFHHVMDIFSTFEVCPTLKAIQPP